MNIFAIIGDIFIRMFNLVGMVILAIPKLPGKIRNVDTDNFKNKIDKDSLKNNISKIKTDIKIEDRISKLSTGQVTSQTTESQNIDIISNFQTSKDSTSKEKEDTILKMQISSGAFIVVSILYLFNFLSLIIFGLLGVAIVAYILYELFNKIRYMYPADFNAYRDFFAMYIAVGIILVLVGSNPNFVMAFSFQFFPSLTVLIFALILVAAVYLIFRIRYHRNYTFGDVIETGKRTAYVKVEYDIRSNVKPDVYVVENNIGAEEGERVKLQIEEKLISSDGNKPKSIIGRLSHQNEVEES